MKKSQVSLASLMGVALLLMNVGEALAGSVTVLNSGFEVPQVNGSYQYDPTLAEQGGSGWTFNTKSGVAANGSAFYVFGADGHQAGFLQSAGAAISQSLDFTESGSVTVSLLAEGRLAYGANPFVVALDGTVLTFGGSGSITPTVAYTFSSYTSDAISVTSGSHTLTFTGQGVGLNDVTSFIDDVSVYVAVSNPNLAPEPATFVSAALGGLFLCAAVRGARLPLRRSREMLQRSR